jgi:Na+/melibiose symporter-like transporter
VASVGANAAVKVTMPAVVGTKVVVTVEVPAETVFVPMTVDPAEKVTMPAAAGATVAVSVTVVPTCALVAGAAPSWMLVAMGSTAAGS